MASFFFGPPFYYLSSFHLDAVVCVVSRNFDAVEYEIAFAAAASKFI